MLEQEMVEMDHAGMAEQLEKIAELRRDVLKELGNRDGRLGKELERLNQEGDLEMADFMDKENKEKEAKLREIDRRNKELKE